MMKCRLDPFGTAQSISVQVCLVWENSFFYF